MNSLQSPFKTGTVALILVFSLALITGCSSFLAKKKLEQLDKVVRIYNNAFESKSEDGGSMYVQNEYRMDYLLKYGEIQNKVNFLNAQILNQAYFKAGKPLQVSKDNPEGDVDEAVLTMRYQVIVSPSPRLKTFIHEQHWKYDGTIWLLEPNLEPFLH